MLVWVYADGGLEDELYGEMAEMANSASLENWRRRSMASVGSNPTLLAKVVLWCNSHLAKTSNVIGLLSVWRLAQQHI